MRLSGEFRWPSGCDHADWAILGFPRRASGGEGGTTPRIHLSVLPRRDYAIIDDWHAAGMRGTGTRPSSSKTPSSPNTALSRTGR